MVFKSRVAKAAEAEATNVNEAPKTKEAEKASELLGVSVGNRFKEDANQSIDLKNIKKDRDEKVKSIVNRQRISEKKETPLERYSNQLLSKDDNPADFGMYHKKATVGGVSGKTEAPSKALFAYGYNKNTPKYFNGVVSSVVGKDFTNVFSSKNNSDIINASDDALKKLEYAIGKETDVKKKQDLTHT